MLINMLKKWKGYRHRFVPWIALNLKNRSKRIVEAGQEDKIVCDDVLLSVLLHLLPNLLSTANTSLSPATVAARNMKVAESVLGFCVRRATSKVPGAGVGVTVARGSVERGSLVALYPGTLYHPHEPILLPSIGNAFVLRCVDGIHVDGSDRRISKMIYKSCVRRDSVWPHQAGDLTWLTEHSAMPLSIGQYVNNHSPGAATAVRFATEASESPKATKASVQREVECLSVQECWQPCSTLLLPPVVCWAAPRQVQILRRSTLHFRKRSSRTKRTG
ncbi:SET domain-containing protein 9-like isoform X1 [Zootermopsis nevadensis]|uniref:SET domain-containing protein 9-like isoform X1 n=1 Tax=Zootermopsis nevadensis TaxID=136037 RepID=UPI000B8E5909|nr:SET domain-containing protein 9-like isoform X1 [Zootermopsis nevadensis]XP_021936424.1 SET domain-containing protein 9-like isoform X1 [Zootermopsis nevadensis]XP_021936425.1 SET domain-containing protein 9-like isoform X1 [Zootermopsis nevadensis]XP_021936426.1 SET domain-containing protein 9-like isoform X1 [Zootermopsis nevadensis]